MTRLTWECLPEETRAAVEALCGPVLKAEPASQGLMPGVAARLRTLDRGGFFVKAVPADSPALGLYIRERDANRALPSAVPAPRLIWNRAISRDHRTRRTLGHVPRVQSPLRTRTRTPGTRTRSRRGTSMGPVPDRRARALGVS
jgi:hypothetical protein